ncbi:MAG: hypothetical protein HYX21_01065 [Candidatus Yanofskybacteria bacterium]|nr:hypothetical protein [Candidatus Yanofskybacteria bacterium]
MTPRFISPAEYVILNFIFLMQKKDMLPDYSWDVMEMGDPIPTGFDQAFGGDWKILKQEFIFRWNICSSPDISKQRTELNLTMRGEYPLLKRELTTEEQRKRWFIEKMKIERWTGRAVGNIEEIAVLEAISKDNVFKLVRE